MTNQLESERSLLRISLDKKTELSSILACRSFVQSMLSRHQLRVDGKSHPALIETSP
jgi:hypothetical protein